MCLHHHDLCCPFQVATSTSADFQPLTDRSSVALVLTLMNLLHSFWGPVLKNSFSSVFPGGYLSSMCCSTVSLTSCRQKHHAVAVSRLLLPTWHSSGNAAHLSSSQKPSGCWYSAQRPLTRPILGRPGCFHQNNVSNIITAALQAERPTTTLPASAVGQASGLSTVYCYQLDPKKRTNLTWKVKTWMNWKLHWWRVEMSLGW